MERENEELQRLITENRKLKKQLRKLKAEAKARKKVEFSKIIFVGVSALVVSVTVYVCYMVWITHDLSPFAYLIPAVFAEFAAATAFYYKKSESENKIKLKYIYMKLFGIKPTAADFSGGDTGSESEAAG